MYELPIMLILFMLGAFFASVMFIRSKEDIVKTLIAIVGAVLLGIRFEDTFGKGLEGFLIGSTVGYIGIFSALLKEKVLSSINERVLLQFSILYIYVFLTLYYTHSNASLVLLILLSIPCITLIFLSFQNVVLPRVLKLIFYIWFIILSVLLIFAYFPEGNIFKISSFLSHINEFSAFITGTTFFYLVSNLTFLYLLIPLKGKHQSWKDRMKEWKELTNTMQNKHEDHQTHIYVALLIIFGQGGLLLSNYLFHFWEDQNMITAIIFSSQLLSMFEPEAKMSAIQPHIIYETKLKDSIPSPVETP